MKRRNFSLICPPQIFLDSIIGIFPANATHIRNNSQNIFVSAPFSPKTEEKVVDLRGFFGYNMLA
jgi:hypothetical protein